jgi:hypothetical protein
VSTDEGVEAAACALVSSLGAGAALVGGHREGAARPLAVREGGSVSLQWLEAERIDVGPCAAPAALASAIAASLANVRRWSRPWRTRAASSRARSAAQPRRAATPGCRLLSAHKPLAAMPRGERNGARQGERSQSRPTASSSSALNAHAARSS